MRYPSTAVSTWLVGVLACFVILVPLAAMTQPQTDQAQTKPSKLSHIQENKQLRVCVWPDYYSISYRNPRSYELSGIDVDLARQLGADLGVPVQFVDSSFATLADDLLADRCDISMFGVGITPDRQERLRFTSPHLFSDVLGITTKNNRKIKTWADIDQPGVVVSVAKGTLHENLLNERLQHATVRAEASPFAREHDVQSGRADVFMTDFPYTRRMLKTTDWARLVAPPEVFHITYYAWAMAPGDDPWFDRVQEFVKSIKKDGRLLKAAKKYDLDPIVVLD